MGKVNTKAKIFDSAVALFAQKGYTVTTIRQIAASVGVNEATIYIYFKNKAAILDEILARFENEFNMCIPNENQLDNYVKKDSPSKFLSRLMWNSLITEKKFMRQAFCIVCMEQYVNKRAGGIVKDFFLGTVAGRIEYAFNKLAELELLPQLDTQVYPSIWAQVLFASAVEAVHAGTLKNRLEVLDAANKRILAISLGAAAGQSLGEKLPSGNRPPNALAI